MLFIRINLRISLKTLNKIKNLTLFTAQKDGSGDAGSMTYYVLSAYERVFKLTVTFYVTDVNFYVH